MKTRFAPISWGKDRDASKVAVAGVPVFTHGEMLSFVSRRSRELMRSVQGGFGDFVVTGPFLR